MRFRISKTIGAIDQSVSDWGYSSSSGFEIRRYDYALNEPGRKFVEGLADQNSERWEKSCAAVKI